MDDAEAIAKEVYDRITGRVHLGYAEESRAIVAGITTTLTIFAHQQIAQAMKALCPFHHAEPLIWCGVCAFKALAQARRETLLEEAKRLCPHPVQSDCDDAQVYSCGLAKEFRRRAAGHETT